MLEYLTKLLKPTVLEFKYLAFFKYVLYNKTTGRIIKIKGKSIWMLSGYQMLMNVHI